MRKTIVHNLKTNWWKYILVSVLIFADLLSKSLTDNKVFSVINGFFNFSSSHNYGAGFSILQGEQIFLIIITLLLIIGLVAFCLMYKNDSKLFALSSSFIFTGAIGNLIDRVFLGYVRDFINLQFMDFPIFNFADIFVCVGVAMLVIYLIFFTKTDKEKEQAREKDDNKS